MSGAEVLEILEVLDRGWWPAPGAPTWPVPPADPFDVVGVRVERDGPRLLVEVWPTTTPRELDRLVTRIRPVLGRPVQHVVLDLHRVGEGRVRLARALDRLRMRLLLDGVTVEVAGAPPVRYRLEEHAP